MTTSWNGTDYNFNSANTTIAPTFNGIARPTQLVVPLLTDMSGIGIYNVAFFGAACDGVTDDTVAVNKAIAALNAAGWGTLFLPGMCAVSSTISIGNGSYTALSTVNSISIVGKGSGAGQVSSVTQKSGFKWIGASGGTVLQINGPAYGIRLEGLLVDGNNGLAAIGIQELNVAGSSFRDVWVQNCLQINWWRLGTANAAGGGLIGPAYTKYDNCGVSASPTLNGASSSQPMIGLCLGGNPTNPYDYAPSTNQTNWGAYEGHYYDFAVLMYGSDNSVGIDLRNCDHNYFDGGFVTAKSSVRCSPNPNTNGFPQGNRFIRADWQPNNKTPVNTSHVTTNGTFVPSSTHDLNYVEFLDNGFNYPGNQPGFSSWPVLNWLAGKTGTGIPFGVAAESGRPLYYVNRANTDSLSNFTTLTQLNSTSYTVAGGALNVTGAQLRIRVSGSFNTTGTPTGRLQLQLGGVVIFDTLVQTLPSTTNGQFYLVYGGVTRLTSAGASAQMITTESRFTFAANSATPTAPGTLNGAGLLATTLNLAAANAITLWASFSVASASNLYTLGALTVEISYPPGDSVA